MPSPDRLVAVMLDPATLPSTGGQGDRERDVAILDLVADNRFAPTGYAGGPWTLTLAVPDGRLVLDVADAAGTPVLHHVLPLASLRRMVRDYHQCCDTYYASIRTAPAAEIEALDRARRALHDAAANHIAERIAGSISTDFATCRGLFTVIAALYWKG